MSKILGYGYRFKDETVLEALASYSIREGVSDIDETLGVLNSSLTEAKNDYQNAIDNGETKNKKPIYFKVEVSEI